MTNPPQSPAGWVGCAERRRKSGNATALEHRRDIDGVGMIAIYRGNPNALVLTAVPLDDLMPAEIMRLFPLDE